MSEGKFQRELQQPRRVSQACNFAESYGVSVIQVTRLRKLRMIEGIKGLGPELETRYLSQCEILEHGSIHVIPSRSARLLWRAAQYGVVGLCDLRGRGRLRKCAWIEPLTLVVRAGINILPGNGWSEAAKVGGCRGGAVQGKRLAALEGVDVVAGPSSNECIHHSVCT